MLVQTENFVFSPFHVTGAHNVLFKYLNPNLLVVSTISEVSLFAGVLMFTDGTILQRAYL